MKSDNKMYAVCGKCGGLVQLNKPLIGSVHFCVGKVPPRKKGPLEDRMREIGNGTMGSLGNGYRALVARGPFSVLAYIELPEDHPDVGKGYDGLCPEVNGGLTFAEGRVFGWDYNHAHNDMSVVEHVKNALEYFRARE